MLGSRKPSLYGVALLFAGALAVVTCLVVGGAAPSPESEMTNDSMVLEKAKPLDCRVVLRGAAERRAALEEYEWLQDVLRRRPDLNTPRLFRNPLLAGMEWAKVEVENTSGRDFAYRCYGDGDGLFHIEARVQDSAGRNVQWENSTKYSLKRLGPALTMPDLYPLKSMKPGQVETYRMRFFGASPEEKYVGPGKYFVKAEYLYFRESDSAECRVQSRPFAVTVTEEDVKEWKELFK